MRMPGFVGPSYESKHRAIAGERTINLYPAVLDTQAGKARSVLWPCPGFQEFATGLDSPGRGIFGEETDRLFAVFGGTVYEIDDDGTIHSRGGVLIDANPATLSTNGNDQMLITSGTKGYCLDLSSNVLTLEVDDVTMGGAIDTFGVALDAVTGTLKISDPDDLMTWDAGQVVQRSAAPDKWIAMIVSRREIFLFGKKTGEVWFNAGTAPFPFAQRPGAFFEIGIEAPFSLAPFGATMAWLGRSARGSGQVFWMNGYTPNPISNEALEWAIEQYKELGQIDDAIGWSYENMGHSFYVLEFPTQGKTWVYDAATNQWHERGRWSSIDNDFVPYRARFHAEMYRKNLVCDSQAGKIYALSSTVYTDVGGTELRRVRRLPHLSDENRRIYLDYVELDCVKGPGLTAGQGSDPLMMFRASWDGGMTYGNERTRRLGKKGQYTQRVRWDRCGSGRDLVLELSSSDPVEVAMCDLYVGVS